MTHLGERITEFVFGDMSPAEMDEARRHVADCADCSNQVQQFERTRAILKMSPEVEPPHRIVFEAEKRSVAWRWFAPIGVAAAIVLAVWIAAPMQMNWHDSQFTIAFGRMPAPPAPAPVNVPPSPVVQPPVTSQPIDYDRIVKELQKSQQAWLLTEFKKRDAEQVKRIGRLQDQLAYLQSIQHTVERQNLENATNISLLARGAQD